MHNKCLVIASVCLFFLPCSAKSADLPEPFRHLTTLQVNHTLGEHGIGDITIHFDENISSVIDTLYQTAEMIEMGFGANHRLIITKIDINDETEYIIDFSPGMSVDPYFIIYINNGNELTKLARGLAGTQLIVPGDGFLYTTGHTNNTFDQRRKFRIEGEKITEVSQPFYFVGLTSKTNREIILWNDPEANNKYSLITTLPKGSTVTVLLKKSDEYRKKNFTYLVKTEFGLVGWVQFDFREITQRSDRSSIEGLYFKGD